MSTLLFVRHGQASFWAADYDQLSALGEEQVRHLGDYWMGQGKVFDEVYVGPRLRQQQTAALVEERYRLLDQPWPQPVLLPELDEYDLMGLTDHLAPSLAAENPAFAELLREALKTNGEHQHAVRFQRMFEILLTHWQVTPTSKAIVESWTQFRERVNYALRQIVDQPKRSRHVVVFSSGGFIGTATALALAAPDHSALELNWRLRNSSVTSFVFSPGRLTLDEFNNVAHLPDRALWTYR